MCILGVAWDLLCVLQMTKPLTFQELATKAHDMEATIANHRDTSFNFAKLKKDKAKFKRNVKFSNNSNKEAMSISKHRASWDYRKAKPGKEKKRALQGHDKEISHSEKNFKRRNICFQIRICLECWMIFLKKESFTFHSQSGPKSLEWLLTPNTTIITRW